MHFVRAARELYPLQSVSEFYLNISNNSIREEGIYAVGDLCLNMTSLVTLKLYFRK
jgi:hypothetical protein